MSWPPGPRIPLWTRFWPKVFIPRQGTPGWTRLCWTWMGAKSKKRRGGIYGAIQLGGRKSKIVGVHWLVCSWFHGPPAPGMEAGHTCPQPNSLCVNPNHLRWMTRTENEAWKETQRCPRPSDAPSEDLDPIPF